MANVMSLKSFSNNVKRNGFDLSFKNAFTAKAGELLPVFCKEVIPGDKFNIKGQAFTRTQPVMSAAYVRMREYFDFFFVPYKLLWNRFPTFFTNLPDYHQAEGINASVQVGDQHPYFTSSDLAGYMQKLNALQDGNENNLFGYSRFDLTHKLLDYLGYGDITAVEYHGSLVFNPFPLFAYQKVCQDYFRDDQWQKAAPYRYNVDYITNTTDLHIPVSTISTDDYNMFDLNYCNYPKDYFMGMLPSSQFGDEAFVPLSGGAGSLSVDLSKQTLSLRSLNNTNMTLGTGGTSSSNPNPTLYFEKNITSTPNLTIQGDGSSNQTNLFVNNNNPLVGISSAKSSLTGGVVSFNSSSIPVSGEISSRLSILALRQAEALQKWKEIAQSGRQDYQTQMQKHFNVNPSDAMSNHCKYLGGWTSNIDINEVLNTNLGDEASQADIKGKGVGTSQGNVDFEAKEHGILIGLYHCMPLLDYGIDGVRKLNMKSHFTDYAIPEFDSIGMQQLQVEELLRSTSDEMSGIQLGWVPRYADYKTSYDEVHGEFNNTLSYWVARLTPEYLQSYFDAVNSKYGSEQITYEFFKVNPSILDNLFGVNVDGSTSTDQFLVNSFFDTKVVRNLDYNGLPY